MTLIEQLIEHEGMRLLPYKCPAGKITIGVGRNLEGKGISYDEAMLLLRNDIQECTQDLCIIFPRFMGFPLQRQNALIDMRLNLGGHGFRSFKKMIKAILDMDWDEAANQAEDSLWAKQVQPARRDRILHQLRKVNY